MRTVVALEANNNNKISNIQAINNIKGVMNLMNKGHLEIVREVLVTIINNSEEEENVSYNIALVKEALREMIFSKTGNSFNQSEEISEDIEYKVLRDNIMYNVMNLEVEELELVQSIFTNLFNIRDSEKRNTLSFIISEVNPRIIQLSRRERQQQAANAARQRAEARERAEASQMPTREPSSTNESTSYQEPEALPTELSQEEMIRRQEEALQEYLNPPSIDNISKYFESQNVKDLVYNVGAPAKNYMTDIIRPNPVAERSCLKDRRFPREPVEVLSSGTPAGAYEFQGIGTMLPKFAYTEVYNDKYY